MKVEGAAGTVNTSCKFSKLPTSVILKEVSPSLESGIAMVLLFRRDSDLSKALSYVPAMQINVM
jgi:hypothetical protein